MKKNIYEELTDEKLLEKRRLLKAAAFGLGLVFLLAIGILIYLIVAKGSKSSFATLPILIVAFIPLLTSITAIDKEIKSRNL